MRILLIRIRFNTDPDPQHCCKAYDKNMEELARTVLASHLTAEPGTSSSPPSFCVFFKTRNNNQVGRDDVVKLMATGTVMDGWHFFLVYGEENILLASFTVVKETVPVPVIL
jgi:hypothetical protein